METKQLRYVLFFVRRHIVEPVLPIAVILLIANFIGDFYYFLVESITFWGLALCYYLYHVIQRKRLRWQIFAQREVGPMGVEKGRTRHLEKLHIPIGGT